MSTYSAANSFTAASITASTVDTIILSKPTLHGVTVTNLSGSAPFFFTVSSIGGPNTQPTVNGTNCYVAASVAPFSETVAAISHNGLVINIISSGTGPYNVTVD